MGGVELESYWDGDQGPIFRGQALDGLSPHNFAYRVVVLKFEDEDGVLVATRPAVVVGAKSDGTFDVYPRGREFDWYGLGKNLIMKGDIWCAKAPDGTDAPNVLANQSFDTYNATVSLSCTTVSGQRRITSSSAFGEVYSGMGVSGTGIQVGTVVDSIESTSSIVLSLPATDSSTGSRVFSRLGNADNWIVGGGTMGISCTTNGTAALTSAAAFGNVEAGQVITGTFIQDGTTVLSKTDDSNLTMSLPATGSSTATRFFVRAGYGFGSGVYSVGYDDPAPPSIFGNRQRLYHASAAANQVSFLIQTPNVTLSPGDRFSYGIWRRAKRDAGANILVGGGFYLRVNDGVDASQITFPDLDVDWTFERQTLIASVAHTKFSYILACYDAIGFENRFDEAFAFRGEWLNIPIEPRQVSVRPRRRPSKQPNANFELLIKGWGGFEEDSNGDGVCDGWAKIGTGGTFSLDRDPANLNLGIEPSGRGAQKIVLSGQSGLYLTCILRGKFISGEEYRLQMYYKNAGALTGSPAAGDFGLQLSTEDFDGLYETTSTSGANFPVTSATSYITRFRELTLAQDHDSLVVRIFLNGVTGTIWLDDAYLWRKT